MPNYIEFDKSQSDLYPVASNAGLTVLGISASNEVFLKDSNGAITVIGNRAPLESILQTDNIASTNIEMRGASLVLDTVNSSLIAYQNSITNNTLTVSTEALTDSHNLKFPDGTGTLILTVNGQGPDASGNINVATGSFTGSFSGSFYGQVIGSVTGTSSFASNATNAVTASYVPLVAGPGISISGLNISASVRTVNAVLPIDGNIALSLSATKTGDSASLASFPTSSLADGTVWIVSGDSNPNNNGDAYIFNSGSQLWYPIAPLDQAAADSRYLLLNNTGSMLAPYALTSALGSYVQNSATSSFILVSSFNAYTSSAVTTSSFNAFTSSALLTAFFSSWTGSFGSQFAGSASYASASTNAVSSSYALTASYALNAGNIDTGSLVTTASFNSYTGSNTSQFAGTASFVAGTLFTGTNLAATSSLAVSASYVRILQGTNITVNYTADGIQISSSAAGGGSGAGVDNIGVANTTQIQLKSGSFFVGDAITVPFASSANTASYVLGSNVVGAVQSASFASTASLAPNYVLNSATSSMLAPYVLSSATSSFVTNSQTSSFVTNSQTSSFITNSQTSSMTVGTASFAPSYVLNSATSSFVTNSQTSSMSVATASFVTASNVVGTVTSSSYALTASFALNATQITPAFIATGSVTASVSPNQSLLTLTSGSTTILRVTGSTLNFPNGGTHVQLPDATIFSDNSNPFRLNSIWGANYPIINASKDATFGTQVNNLALSSFYATLTLGVTGSIVAYSAWDINPNVFTIQKAYAGDDRNLSGANETLLNINNKGNGFGTFGGISRGVYVDLLITASGFNDYRAIETTVGNVTLNTVSGNTLIGTTTSSGHKLYVSGSGPSGSLNVNNTLTVSGSSVVITGSLIVSGSSTFTNIGPAVFSGSVTMAGTTILQGTSSFAQTASLAQALTNISYLINTGSVNAIQTITGSLTVTQNLTVLGSASIAYLTASQTLVNQNTITVFGNGVGLPNASYIAADTSSLYPSSSLTYNIVNQKWFVDKPFSGSLEGVFTGTVVGYLPNNATSSMLSPYVLTTTLSSYVPNSVTSSMLSPYVLTSSTSSMSVATASFISGNAFTSTNPALTSSFAITASFALNAGNINTGSLITTSSFNQYTSSVSSQFAGTASFATTASFIVNTQFLPIVIEAKIDSNAIPLTSSFTPSISVFGLRSGSTAVTSSNFINRQVEVFRNGNLLPGINLGGGEDYITKAFGSNTITFINALDTDEYIKIKCL
jgi:hypothetical protein